MDRKSPVLLDKKIHAFLSSNQFRVKFFCENVDLTEFLRQNANGAHYTVKITEILSLTHFNKNFVKVTVLSKN